MRAITACLLASAFALSLASPAEARCTDLASRKAPRLSPPEMIPGPDGPFTYRRADYAYCRDDGWVYRYGIADANGSALVPPEFTHAVLIGPRHALVREPVKKHSKEPGPWQYYEIGKGITGPAPAFEYVGPVHYSSLDYARTRGMVSVPHAYITTERSTTEGASRYDYYLFPDGLPTPRRYPDLGGPALSRWDQPMVKHGNVLFTSFTAPDGQLYSRLLNLRGEPVSPVLGRVEVWRTSSFEGTNSDVGSNQTALGDELFVVVPLPPHPELPKQIYVPLREDGTARPLPPDVVGVFPLLADIGKDGNPRSRGQSGRVTFGWAVVLDTPQGLRFVVGNGLIADVLDLVGKQTPVAGVKHLTGCESCFGGFLLLKSAEDGLWRAVTPRFNPPYVADPDKGYATAQLAFDATDKGVSQRRTEDRARQEREYAESKKREFEFNERRYQELLAKGGDFCRNDPKVIQFMHAPAINRMLSECGVTDFSFLQNAEQRGADPALIQRALAKRESDRRDAEFRRMESDRRSREISEAQFRARVDAASRFSDLMRGMNNAHDSFMQKSRDTYYQNLDAWNRGAQNWGGPRD